VTRLKLRDDAYYAQTSDGVCILTNEGKIELTGPSIFQWVDRLAPYLDGKHTLAELTASMPDGRRAMTERVIRMLRDRQVVVEAAEADDTAPPLSVAEQHAYRREIGFLGYFSPSAERSFQAYRDSPVVLVGAGRMLAEIMDAALCSGSRQLRVVVTGDCPTDEARLAESERRAGRRDPAQLVTRASADLADENQLLAVLDGAGMVIQACDGAAVARSLLLDEACGRLGIPFVTVMLVGDEAWFGPFGSPAGQQASWTSAWRRLLAHDSDHARIGCRTGAGQNRQEIAVDGITQGAAPAVVASQLMRQVVRLLSGTVGQPARDAMTRVDMLSLETQSHRFQAHPFSLAVQRPDEASLLATVAQLGEGARVDADEFDRRAVACLEPRLGVLGEVTQRDFMQVPLAVSQVQVSDPVLLLGHGAALPAVVGAGLSLAEARRAAVLRGLALYASLMVDPRRIAVRRGDADLRTGDPEEDLRSLVEGLWDGYVWGYGLADGLPHDIPATVVFPALGGAQMGYLPPAGAAAGYDWREAVRRGLLGECRRLTLEEVAYGRAVITPVEWDDVPLGAPGDRYRSMVRIIGQRLDVYDVTGSPGLPALAFCLDGVAVAYSCGFSFAQALCDGLADVLLCYQAQLSDQSEYALPGIPPLPQRGRLARVEVLPAWSTDEAKTAVRLVELGWTAAAVPLDHDPVVAASVLPYLVNVVLTRA
jgi:hypothetical protein